MPLLAPAPDLAKFERRIYRLEGLPDFNVGTALTISAFEGLRDTPVPDVVLVPNGGGAGAADVGDWEDAEQYYSISGRIRCTDRAQMLQMRRLLLAALPSKHRAPVQILDPAGGLDLEVLVRRYDKPDIAFAGYDIKFTVPLVAPDPYKYAIEPVSGQLGVFTGESWFRTYTGLSRRYELSGGRWVRRYRRAESQSPYPPSLSLVSGGDAVSSRVIVTIVGPLVARDWWLINETTGTRLFADVPIQAGQELVLDSARQTARLAGSPVEHLVYGDWPKLVPGPNIFRLAAGTSSAAYATVSAVEAHQ